MALIKINGRTNFFNVDKIEIKKVSNGRWEVAYDGDNKFLVVGGRQSGGASNEWFCCHPKFYGERWLPTKSMVEAIRLGAVY